MGRRPLVVMVLGWCAVVGAVSAITFVVVSNAGSGIGRASAAERVIVVPPEAPGTLPVTPKGTPAPSAAPTTSATPTPTTSKPGTPSDAPEPEPTSRAPRPSGPAADPHTASFSTQGGIVVATCRSSQVVLKSIRPRDGWRFDPEKARGALEVQFKTAEREVEIYLRCVDGVPTRLTPGANWGADESSSSESPSRSLVRPEERVHSEGREHATPTASSTPSRTEETPHG